MDGLTVILLLFCTAPEQQLVVHDQVDCIEFSRVDTGDGFPYTKVLFWEEDPKLGWVVIDWRFDNEDRFRVGPDGKSLWMDDWHTRWLLGIPVSTGQINRLVKCRSMIRTFARSDVESHNLQVLPHSKRRLLGGSRHYADEE